LPILALAYTYASWYIPIVYLNILLTIVFAFAVGFLVNKFVIEKGKVRNKTLGIVFGLIAGLVAMYFNYAIWINLLFGLEGAGPEGSLIQQILAWVISPIAVFGTMKEINAVGTWGIKSSGSVSGLPLTIIWIIEGLVVIVLPIVMSLGRTGYPFCEETNTWAEEQEISGLELIEDQAAFVSALEAGDMSVVKAINASNSPFGFATINLFSNEGGEKFMTVTNQLRVVEDDGKENIKSDEVIEYVKITDEAEASVLSKLNQVEPIE